MMNCSIGNTLFVRAAVFSFWCFLLTPMARSQQNQDSISIAGSGEIGDTRNLLLERIQYKEGSLFRNDFVRDYSAFDVRRLSLASQPSFSDELLYRDAAKDKVIALSTKENAVKISFIPQLGATFYSSRNGASYWKRSNGLAVAGSIGQNFVFYAKAIDNALRGASPDMKKSLSEQPTYVASIGYGGAKGYDYDDTEVQLGFRLGIVDLYLEKIRNTWGYGRGGQLVLSDRAPSYPQIRASVQILRNLKLTVLGGILNSGIIDSSQSYTDYTDGTYKTYREVNRTKYLFAHVLEYSPINELNIALGEEIVASDRLTPEYLVLPAAIDHNLGISGVHDNMNVWGGARFTYPNLGSVYTTVYVDNFGTNQSTYNFAGSIGATLVDVSRSDLDFTIEYTALRPFVYANDNKADNRTTNGFVLGDWLGENGERMQVWLDYRPAPQLWFTASYVTLRKGKPGVQAPAGSTAVGSVGFLDGPLFKRNEFDLRGRWEVYSGVFADISYRLITQSDQVMSRYPSFSNRPFLSFALKLNIFDRNDEW